MLCAVRTLWTCAVRTLLVAALAGPAIADDRTIEILHYDCGTEFGRRDITLFKNGTLRVLEGTWNDQHMYLTEIGPEAVADNIRVLAAAYASEDIVVLNDPLDSGLHGEWMETCRLRMALPGLEVLNVELSQYEIPPLKVTRILAITEELLENFPPPEAERGLPAGYQPRGGDVLRSVDGDLYRVVRMDEGNFGVELEALDQPIIIYLKLTDLPGVFTAIERRQPAR